MINNFFEKTYAVLNKWRKLTLFLVTILFLFSGFRLFSVPFNNNVELMLPDDAEFLRSLKFLRESDFSDKVVLSLHIIEENKTVADLIEAVEQLKGALKPPLVEKIESGIVESEVLDDIQEFFEYVPQIVTEDELFVIEKEITAENVRVKLKQGYKNMLSMNSMFLNNFIRNDPISVKTGYLKEIKGLAESMGYRAKIQKGNFISMDEKHAMLILTTPVLITDSEGARRLIDYIGKQIESLPEYVEVDVICGHRHTLSNEDILKKDIAKTVFIATFMLLILIIVVFRSLRALLVFLIPAVAIVISMNMTSMLIGSLSSFVVGLSAVVVGITVDYGIHIYLAMQSGGVRTVHKISKPILVGVFTTMGVFASFFFSTIYGYQQFALLTNLSIVISIFFYLFILPRLFYEKKKKVPIVNVKFSNERFKLNDKIITLLWVVILCSGVFFSQKLMFGNDVRVYDGSSDDVFDAEERFHDTWGSDDKLAMLVAHADSLDEVLKMNESLNFEMGSSFGEEKFVSISDLYPPEETRVKNLLRWNAFWKNENADKLKVLLQEQGGEYGYSEIAFNPFFDNLNATYIADTALKVPRVFDSIKKRFLQKTKSGYYAILYFADTKVLVDKVRRISDQFSGTFIVSRNNMAKSISESVYQEVKKLAWIAGVLIVFLTILLLKNIRLTLLALIPVVTSIFMILGCFSLFGYALNAPAMIAILVVVGLCIDYGVFMVYDCRFQLEAGTLLAVTLSAVTTIVGGSVLLLATHPVLFYVGMTMAIGIFSGYLAAVFVIPACYRLWVVTAKSSVGQI